MPSRSFLRARTTSRRPRRGLPTAVAGLLAVALLPLVALTLPAPVAAAPVAAAAVAGRAATPTPNAPMRMQVGSDHPLLLTQMNIGNDMAQTPGFIKDWNDGWSMGQIWASVPDDVKGNIGFVLHQGHNSISDNNPAMSEQWLRDNVAEADSLGIPVFILWDEGRTLRTNASRWTFLESLYQDYPHFMGTVVSEQTDTLADVPEALRIANLYGGFHVLGSLEEDNLLGARLEDQTYWNSVAQYSENFIFNPKNFHKNFETVNGWTQGAWLAGAFDNWGPYFDGYPYYGCGYFGLNPSSYTGCGDRWSRSMAETVASSMLLDQWQNGATVFHLENQLDIPTRGSLYSPYFYQSILPAFRWILTHHTPTKQDIIERTGVAFDEKGGTISGLADTADSTRTTFYSHYEGTPEFTTVQKSMWYYLRSSGRYGFIPRIPKLAPQSLRDALTASGATLLTKATYDPTLQFGAARQALFDGAYPRISTGDAFVQKAGQDWLIYNNQVRDNFEQDATLLLTGDSFTGLSMPRITPHTWATLHEDDDAVSMRIDTYATDREADLLKPRGPRDMEFNRDFVKYAYVPNPQDTALRTTTLRFTVATRPTLTISGYDGSTAASRYSYTETYDPDQDLYTLRLRSNGVVDLRLSTADHEQGWSSIAADSPQVRTAGGATEVVFDGTSIAVVGGSGSVAASIDGVALDPSVTLGSGTSFRATGLTNSVHTLRLEGGGAATASYRYVPSVEHEARTLESDDFNYGSRADDDDVVYGSEGWRVLDGRLRIVPFVFPFYGDTTVYNTNRRLADVSLSATLRLDRGTSGSLVVRGDEDAKTGYVFRLDPSRSGEGRNGTTTVSCSLLQNYPAGGSLNSTWTPLASCPTSLTLSSNTDYRVTLTAQGGTITAAIDGTTVLTYTGATNQAAGYTAIRAPQAQSDKGGGCTAGGNQVTVGATCLGQFVEVDDVVVTDLSGTRPEYRSSFDTWDDAAGWMTETPLVFDANTTGDPRSSYSFAYDWTTTGAADWDVVRTSAFTSGLSGYYEAVAEAGSDLVAVGGQDAAWATSGSYDHWAWLRVRDGDAAGLVVRSSANGMYQARLDVVDQTVALGRVQDGVWTEIASAPSPVPVARDRWTLLKVSLRGPLITVDVDGLPALSAADRGLATGAAGVWVPAGGRADVDDARVVTRPTVPLTTAPPTITVVPTDGIAARHITGIDEVSVKTARTKQPDLPATVTARYSDGTTDRVAVTWPAITASQLAVATNPSATGPSQGIFTIDGTVAGTTLTAPAVITVMPNLVNPPTITGTYDPAAPSVPTQTPGSGTFSDGTSTWTRTLFVRWDAPPRTAPGSPKTQVITGSIGGYPWEKVSATLSVVVDTTVPGAPTGVTATPRSGRAVVSWTAPADDGGTTITGYTATASPGGATCSTTGATTCTVTGLTDGTEYTFTVVATNAKGSSAASAASAPVTPRASVPEAPTGVEAVAAAASATVSWTAPSGAAVTGYRVSAAPGGATCSTTTATTCTVSGLTDGTTYRFTVVASNAEGDSDPSAPSASVVPGAGAVPGAPTGVSLAVGNGQLEARWTAPASDGGSPLTGYVATASPGGSTCTVAATTTSCVLRGLTNGTATTVTVRARNARGLSTASAASASATPTAANVAVGKPTTSYYTFGGSTATNNANRVVAKMVDGDATSNDVGYFTGGNSEGALLNYAGSGGDLCSWAYVDLGADHWIGSYRIMFGQNSTNSGNRMWDSPYQIQVLTAAQAAAATVAQRNSSPCPARTFAKGTGNYNTAAYVVAAGADIWTTVDSGTGTLTLDNHTLSTPVRARYVRVFLRENTTGMVYGTAVNELELLPAATAGAPEPPTAVTVTPADGTAAVSWTAPTGTGGSALTGYTATATPGGASCTASASERSCTITGLDQSTDYTVQVTAASAAGTSVPSDPSPVFRAKVAVPPAAVAGTVAAAGQPVAGVCVYLYTARTAPAASYASCTRADGGFVIADVAAGTYEVAVADPTGVYATRWHDTPLVVSGSAVTDLALTVEEEATGAVAGTVTDAPSGDPLANVCVFAYPHGVSTAAAYATCTSTTGSYGLYGIAAAEYDLAFFDPTGVHRTRWWTGTTGGSPSQQGAGVVTVPKRGGQVTADLAMPRDTLGAVGGRVTAVSDGSAIEGACVYLYTSAAGPAVLATCTQPDGTWYLGDVPAGTYRVGFADPGRGRATQWWTGSDGGAPTYAGGADLTVTARQTRSGVDAVLRDAS